MSWQPAAEPAIEKAPCPGLDAVIVPRVRDLGGGFEVRRILPSAQRRMVGPFVFLDHMGPTAFAPGTGLDVRPHPHIALATITFLFEGEILHRDSLGSLQPIRPGEVNWMTAGRGIAHSERTPPELRPAGSSLHGLQAWVALPQDREETDPEFMHHPASDLPAIEGDGLRMLLIAGSLSGKRSPVRTLSELFYADAALDAGALFRLPAEHAERALYLVSGSIELGGEVFEPGRLLVFRGGDEVPIRARAASRAMLLGGAPLGPRHIWWNFVSSSQARIDQAKADWKAGRFAPVPGETEFIPLPD
jgi:redox-sensitive bicupin YhaK (pirin superfamily)